MSSGCGSITWWGFSPALHLLEQLTKYEVEFQDTDEINVLLVGAADARHIIKTLQKSTSSTPRINFYLVENSMETLARQILFLTLLLEPEEEMNMVEKCERFLELFGNTLLREQTDEYLRRRCDDFIQWVTSSATPRDPIWNFSHLKFKERDALEGIFKLWRNKRSDVFDVAKCWDGRLRQQHGTRYDSRVGTYDWDYSMKLKPKAKIVRWAEYKQWRECGVAFQKRDDASYEVPNKTLASGIEFNKDGDRVRRRGYWGDIINGPYFSFGIECENDSMLEVQNNEHTKSSTDVAFYNIMSLVYELHTGKKYDHKKETSDEKENGVIIEEVDEEEIDADAEQKAARIETSNIMIHLLPLDCMEGLHKKAKFQSKFDLVFFSNSMVHNLTESVRPLFRKDGLLVVESTRFMLELKDEMHTEYYKKISAMAASAGCEVAKTFDSEKHNFAYFKSSC